MAVPAASEDQAAAVNGFPAQGTLGGPPPEGMLLVLGLPAAGAASCSALQICFHIVTDAILSCCV